MAHLIDKDAALAEIEKRIKSVNNDAKIGAIESLTISKTLNGFKSFLDTLEVKEVDYDKEVTEYLNNFENANIGHRLSLRRCAKHFFSLGMCVNNPITATDRGMAEEIIINLKRVEQDYRINLTKEIEWVRNKVQKGEEV